VSLVIASEPYDPNDYVHSSPEQLPQMRILVTGGAGFIGAALCRYLVGRCGYSVLNVDKLTYAASLQSLEAVADHSNYRFVQLDIVNGKRMVELTEEFEPDAIVHLAAETHVDRSIDCAAPFIETNVTGTYVLLEVARRYWANLAPARRHGFRFVMVSTDEVYGPLRLQDSAVTETALYDPSSPYAASKAAGDHLARAWYRTYDLPVIISNCSNNFGPYQFPDKLIPLTILNALEGKTIGIYGRGENVRDWLYVDDHVRALLAIIQRGKPGEKYNISARNQRTNLELASEICDILDELVGDRVGRRALIQFVADRPGHDLRYAIDPSKLERELGWSPMQSFETALRETIGWYTANRSWWVPIRQSSYAGERLGRAEGFDVA
jgi:dTDP-glucose 4,6-dehydratase